MMTSLGGSYIGGAVGKGIKRADPEDKINGIGGEN